LGARQGGWVRKVSKAKKTKIKLSGGQGKRRFQKNLRSRKKKLARGQGENKVAKQTKAEKGQTKQSTCDGTWIEKIILSMHHQSTLVHWWVLVQSSKHKENVLEYFCHLYKKKPMERFNCENNK